MPGDRLAFTVLVRRQQELVGLRKALLQVGDDLLLSGVDDVVGLEAVVDVDTERPEPLSLGLGDVLRTIRKVTDVSDARPDRISAPEVTLDRPRLGG